MRSAAAPALPGELRPAGRVEEAARARAAGDEVRTVIAGYHWFTDWGRDTMISLEGLTLCTGRQREAGYILRTFGHYVRDGKIAFEEQAGVLPVIEAGVPDMNPMGCQKGASWSKTLNGGERVRHPLKRVGARGSGVWEQVSWEQACDEIVKLARERAGWP